MTVQGKLLHLLRGYLFTFFVWMAKQTSIHLESPGWVFVVRMYLSTVS